MKTSLDSYLNTLEREMKWNGTFHKDAFAELESHLLDSVEANIHKGLNQAEAEEEALRRFGSGQLVASGFEMGKTNPKQQMMTVFAVLTGLFSLYLNTRPGVDDMSALVFLILLVCGSLALFGYWRPWQLALAAGAWIPFYGVFFMQSYGSVLVLMIAFVGAYAGWALRAGIYKLRRLI